MHVLNFPIEPIEDRYSKQWATWFHDSFSRNNFEWITLTGDEGINYEADPGQFLNPELTFKWKFDQLKEALEVINSETDRDFVAFFHDAWFPGMEALKYAAEMRPGTNLKIVGFWHAGSYLSNDMLGIKGFHSWARGSEQTWFRLCDAVCVGSEYHKSRILASLGQRDTDADKVYATGYPIEIPHQEKYLKIPKEDIIVWPHRIAEDKHPEIFERLSYEACFDGWRFIRSKDVCETKNEYYTLLARAKIAISTATMETFGIAMVEAACLGCDCIVPDDLCYPEFFHPESLYGSYRELKQSVLESIEFWERERPFYAEESIEQARNMAFEHSQEIVTDAICEIIEQVANG